MLFLHCCFLVLSIIAVNGVTSQYYTQPNNQYYGNYRGNYNNRNLNGYSGNYNNIYKSNYNDNVDKSVVRFPEAAVRPGELLVEVNEVPGQTPCRNKEANKDHKDTLWWTLPIPPMELEGPPEKPPQIKQESFQAVEKAPPSQGGGYETGAIQQKHAQPAPPAGPAAATTPKAQPAAPTQAVVQVATTQAAKHEPATTQAAKADKQKVAQMQQKQQAAASAASAQQQQQQQQQGQPQQSAPAPTQLVVSNKESNNMQMIANKSVATMKAPNASRMTGPIMPHGANKQKVMLNRMEPALYQYGDTMGMPQGYVNNYPYYNSPYLRDSPLAPRGYRADTMQDTIAELADNMYKEFDTNDAELGGGAVIGENAFSRQGHQNMLQYDNLSPYQHQDPANQWGLPDERNKRNLKNTAAIS